MSITSEKLRIAISSSPPRHRAALLDFAVDCCLLEKMTLSEIYSYLCTELDWYAFTEKRICARLIARWANGSFSPEVLQAFEYWRTPAQWDKFPLPPRRYFSPAPPN